MKSQRFAWVLLTAISLAGTPAWANLSFNLVPDSGTPQFAIDGFNRAAGLWSAMFSDNITVNIQIGYTPLGPGIVGETSSEFVERGYAQVLSMLGARRESTDDFSAYAALQPGPAYSRLINHTSNNPNGPDSGTPYVDTIDRVGMTTANAKVLGFLAPSGALDATIRFSSSFSFDFSHGESIAPGKVDFVGAAAHEIGHALGFVSGVDDIDVLGGIYPGDNFSSNLLDLFRYSTLSLAAGPGFTDYTADAREKFFSVDGGATTLPLFSTGVSYGDGRQASHWKDNLGLGLMDPTISYGERVDLTGNDLRAFDVMGYTLIPEPSTGGLLVMSCVIFARRRRRTPC